MKKLIVPLIWHFWKDNVSEMEDILVVARGGGVGLLKGMAPLGIPVVSELFSVLTVMVAEPTQVRKLYRT